MIVDLEQAGSPPLDGVYDVCIAGAGVAGITLAKRLADAGRRVLLLEGGGMGISDESQDLYKGPILGRDYFDLDIARLRYLGGTSNHWGGWCRPLDASDFLARPAVDDAGWPIGRADLDPYLAPACDILGIEAFREDQVLPGSSDGLKEVWFRFSEVRFKAKYGTYLEAAERLSVLINANLVDIALDAEGGGVAFFRVRPYGSERATEAKARHYVLALGAIENARTLLNADRQRPQGLGNDHGLVGRYFMEHPHFNIGYFLFDRPDVLSDGRRFWAPTPRLQQAEAIANCSVRLVPAQGGREKSLRRMARDSLKAAICSSDLATDLMLSLKSDFLCPVKTLKQPDLPSENAAHLQVASEQAPNPQSRVVLTGETDRFGLRRAGLDWRLSGLDKKTIRTCGLAVGAYLARRGLGRAKLHDWLLSEAEGLPGFDEGHEVAGFHHMGTTRMGRRPGEGVVDGDCRVFGVPNLYLAGSSVFRTGGYANPTLTIVQLALRLADRLAASR